MICASCGEDLPTDEFVWDDGHLAGISKRCRDCRRPCEDCKRHPSGRVYERCDRHEASWRGPVFPSFRYRVRPHAVRRFIERVRPGLSGAAALLEMLRLAEVASETLDAPAWLEASRSSSARFHRGYLLVSDDVVFALAEYGARGVMVSTVMVRGGGQS